MTRRIFAFFAIITLLCLPAVVLAAGSEVGIPNPIACQNLPCLLLTGIRLTLGVLGLFGLFMFMWGGFLMLTSSGNAEQVTKAKDTLVWSTLGIIVILGSWVFLSYVLKVFTTMVSG